MKSIRLLIAAFILASAGISSAFAQDKPAEPPVQQPDDTIPAQVLEDFYQDVWQQIGDRYYNPDALKDWGKWQFKYKGKLTTLGELDKAVTEMVNSLGDRWTRYTAPDDLDALFFDKLAGVVFAGMQLEKQADGTYRVRAFVYGSPAHKSDLRTGDVVKSIGGKELKDLSDADVEKLLYGQAGAKLELVYVDAGKDVSLTIELGATPPAVVESQLLPGNLGYVRLPHFSSSRVLAQLQAAVAELQKQAGGDLQALILDLRANPGGRFEFAIEGAHLFLESGTIVSSRTRRGRITTDQVSTVSPVLPYVANAQSAGAKKLSDLLLHKPLVVLQDGSTASASEIVIGALKDNGRARTVGTTTVGKAVGYSTNRLDNDGILTITELKYLTPKGTDIYHKGITPDVVVTQPRGSKDAQLDAAVQELTRLVKGARPGSGK